MNAILTPSHTQGPWIVIDPDPDFDHEDDEAIIECRDGYAIARVTSCQEDAALIAAAPELLDALKKCRNMAVRLYSINGDSDAVNASIEADKIIAKATGKEA